MTTNARGRPTHCAAHSVDDVAQGFLVPFMNAGVKLLATTILLHRSLGAITGHLLIMLIVFLPKYRWTTAHRHPLIQVGRSVACC